MLWIIILLPLGVGCKSVKQIQGIILCILTGIMILAQIHHVDIYRHIKDNQHLSIDEYINLSWTNEGNGITLKAFRWDNYITQCMYLFPQWFWVVVYSTRTSLGRSEREKLLGAEIHGLSATELLNYIDNNIYGEEDIKKLNEMIGKKSKKWIINLDLDYFYESNDDGFFQLLSDEYISMLAYKLKNIRDKIQVLTIAGGVI